MDFAQSTHRQTLIDILTENIRQKASEETLTLPVAATRVLMDWLGFEQEDVEFIDAQDRGIDAWISTDSGFDIFQIKTHDINIDAPLILTSFDAEGVHDLERAKNFLLYEKDTNVQNKKLKQLLYRWHSKIHSYQLDNSSLTITVTLHLVILGEELTSQAFQEFRTFQASIALPSSVSGLMVQFHATLHTLDDIINERWREENRQWQDRTGRRYDRIILRPWNEKYISDNASAIFYCCASDLVKAYDALGYQLFEPNVRANIKSSRVNQAIRDSILHQRTRHDFRFLNNGVTIICNSFAKPSSQRTGFNVIQPGVVNGLQTVVALHTAYLQLNDAEKEDFDKQCSVLVRLLASSAVDDITQVVKATNNQNPMKPRNLVSNSIEQLMYARIFAKELGWFYEAKEGAWDAFENDWKRWRPSLKKQPKDFRTKGRKVRRVDNQELAQTWLAFIGFANEAVNEKKSLFSEDRFYNLIFKQRVCLHGLDYGFDMKRARESAEANSPSESLMLVSYLTRKFAEEMTLSASENRQKACMRLGIDPTAITKAELDYQLSQDTKFLLNQVLSGSSLLFTEFVGFIFYRAFGENVHHYGHRILKNQSFDILSQYYTIEPMKEQIETNTFNEHDLLIILWLVFIETLEDMINSEWGSLYRAAHIKVRFLFSQKETRERLYRIIQQTNEFMKKRNLKSSWAVGVADGMGLFEFVRSCVMKPS